MKLMKLDHLGRAVLYKCPEILLADILVWQEFDRGFPKFDRNPKNLHDITDSELWTWNNFF